jgi:hypothetical protein
LHADTHCDGVRIELSAGHAEPRKGDRTLGESLTHAPVLVEKPSLDEQRQRLAAGVFAESPETLGLLACEPKAGHLGVLAADPIEHLLGHRRGWTDIHDGSFSRESIEVFVLDQCAFSISWFKRCWRAPRWMGAIQASAVPRTTRDEVRLMPLMLAEMRQCFSTIA